MAVRYRRATDKPRRSISRVDRRRAVLAARLNEATTDGQRLGAHMDHLRMVLSDAPAEVKRSGYRDVIALIAQICRDAEQEQTRMRRTAA